MNNSPFPLTGPNPDFLADGTPRPKCPLTGQPMMTAQEANWHAHVSGMAARADAQATGACPAAESAMVGTAAAMLAPATIAGITLRPLTLGTMLTLKKLGSAYAQEGDGQPIALSELEIVQAALIFSEPEWCYLALEEGRLAELTSRAVTLAFKIDRPALDALNRWVDVEMAKFSSQEAQEKKPLSPAPAPELAPPPSPASSASAAAAPSPAGSSPSLSS